MAGSKNPKMHQGDAVSRNPKSRQRHVGNLKNPPSRQDHCRDLKILLNRARVLEILNRGDPKFCVRKRHPLPSR